MKWYQRDPLRALEGMAELTWEEIGAYTLLIEHAYARDGDLPDDDAMIARLLRCHWRSWRAMKDVLVAKGKIILEGGKIVPNGVQETLKKASELSQKQSKNGSRRWQKWKKDSEINETGEKWHYEVASTTTTTTTPTTTKKERKKQPVAEPPEFADFWNSVPKKKGRHASLVEYVAAVSAGASPFQINAAAKRWAREEIDKKTEEKYILWPERWLKYKRFEDYHTTATADPDDGWELYHDHERGCKAWRKKEQSSG